MEKYLHRCLDSLIIAEKEMLQLEVLIINDGSKDSSLQIAHEYQNRFPNTFRVIDKENGNYGSCINCGLQKASGEYVKVLDADDWFDKNALQRYIQIIDKYKADLILNDFDIVDNSGKIIENKRYSLYGIKSESVIDIESFLTSTNNFYGQMHGFCYRLSILKEMGYKQTEGISYTDQEWVMLPFYHIRNILYIHENVYKYVIGREGQTMSSVKDKSILQLMEVILNMSKFYQDHECNNIVCTYALNQIMHQLNFIYLYGLIKESYDKKLITWFDKQLQEYSEVYKKTQQISWKKIKYVKYWQRRNHHLPSMIKLLLRL